MADDAHVNPFDAPEEATSYDAWFRTPLGAHADRVEKDLIARLARARAGERALDVGTGTGHYAAWLADRGLRVTAVDASEAMLAVARTRPQEIAWRQGSAAALPFEDASFDMVLSVTMLEFVDRPSDTVAEMRRVVRPGGRLVVAVLNRENAWARAREAEAAEGETPFSHAHFYSPREFVELLAPHGRVTWGSALFVGPDGRALAVGGLVERIGRLFFAGRGALLVARVDVAEGMPRASEGGKA